MDLNVNMIIIQDRNSTIKFLLIRNMLKVNKKVLKKNTTNLQNFLINSY